MINLKAVSAGQALSYFEKDNYYSIGEQPSDWVGKGAEVLGLTGPVDNQAFSNLLNGKLPDGTEMQAGPGGERRAGYDLTISAPKSVSIMALVGGDERLVTAHDAAVRVALERAEACVAARAQMAGETVTITTGNAVIASFRHDTSRALDPQLHTHNLLMNMTQRPDGSWRALEPREIFSIQKELDQIYKSELALRLHEIGYEVRLTKNGFELAQINDRQIEEFSKRNQQIEAALAERGLSRETASPDAREAANLDTRDKKLHVDHEMLAERWREQARECGVDLRRPAQPGIVTDLTRHASAAEAVEWAARHLGEREQRFTREQLATWAGERALGQATTADIHSAINRAREENQLIERRDGSLTTPAALLCEMHILRLEVASRCSVAAVLQPEAAAKALAGYQLNPQQREAALGLLAARNRFVGVEGLAGTGKSTMLAAFVEQAKAQGYTIQAIAPSHSAVDALKEKGVECRTSQGWLADRNATNELNGKTIVIVDESGLASAQQLRAIMQRIEAAGARGILVGDLKQYNAVDAGRPVDQLQKNGMETHGLTEMQRQKVEYLQEAARLAAEGRGAEALQKLEVREIKNRNERHAAIAKDFAGMTPEKRCGSLVLTGTNADRQSLNNQVRAELGLAGKGQQLEVFQRGDWTTAQKTALSSYQGGEMVRLERDLTRRQEEATKGSVWRVEGIEAGKLLLERNGEHIKLKPSAGKSFTVGTVETREFSQGDRLRFTGTGQDCNGGQFKNGERGTVERIDHDRLAVRMDDGRMVALAAAGVLAADHGYASTGHSAQGLGSTRVLMDRDASSPTTSERQFYTDLTRATHECVVYTNSVEKLAEAVERQTHKTTALEEFDHRPPGRDLDPEGPGAADRAPGIEAEGPSDREFDQDGIEAREERLQSAEATLEAPAVLASEPDVLAKAMAEAALPRLGQDQEKAFAVRAEACATLIQAGKDPDTLKPLNKEEQIAAKADLATRVEKAGHKLSADGKVVNQGGQRVAPPPPVKVPEPKPVPLPPAPAPTRGCGIRR